MTLKRQRRFFDERSEKGGVCVRLCLLRQKNQNMIDFKSPGTVLGNINIYIIYIYKMPAYEGHREGVSGGEKLGEWDDSSEDASHQKCLTAAGRSAKKHTKKWPPDLSFAKCLGIL